MPTRQIIAMGRGSFIFSSDQSKSEKVYRKHRFEFFET